ncbi:MAG TPA: energy transducer TonB [Vicinamibacterales bacterium]|nr:energy transducer TonB [Vicinamibacterales bacterium]
MKTVIAILVATIAVAAQDQVEKPGNGVTMPQVVKTVKAQYTQEARDAHIEGRVTVDAVVLADGTVGQVKLEKSLDPTYGLDQAALDATKQWTFKPGTKDGKPIAVQVAIEHTFTLK